MAELAEVRSVVGPGSLSRHRATVARALCAPESWLRLGLHRQPARALLFGQKVPSRFGTDLATGHVPFLGRAAPPVADTAAGRLRPAVPPGAGKPECSRVAPPLLVWHGRALLLTQWREADALHDAGHTGGSHSRWDSLRSLGGRTTLALGIAHGAGLGSAPRAPGGHPRRADPPSDGRHHEAPGLSWVATQGCMLVAAGAGIATVLAK